MSRLPRLVLALAATSLIAASCSNDSDKPSATEAPVTEAPVAEAPSTDAPSTEAPTTDAPTTDAPTTEAPTTESPTTDAPTTDAPSVGSIIDVATEAGNFTTLLAAVDAAGLTETLSTGSYTLLAPTDDAFAALGQDAVDALLADPDQLAVVLRLHVLPSPQDASLVGIMTNLITLDGNSLDVVVDGDTVTIAGATVVQADIAADNGIIHAIDTVILPEATTPA